MIHEINLDRSDPDLLDQMSNLGLRDREENTPAATREENPRQNTITAASSEKGDRDGQSEGLEPGDETTVSIIRPDDVD